MAKMRRYDIAGANFSIIPHAQGDYIKVSELSDWMASNCFYTSSDEDGKRVIDFNTLLAAIDTEVLGKKKFVKMLVDIHGYKAGNMFPVHQEIPSNDGTKIVYFDCRKYYFADDNKAYIDNAIAELVEAP